MNAVVLDWLLQAVPLWVGCLLIVVIATAYLTNKYNEAKRRLEDAEKGLSGLPCSERGKVLEDIKETLTVIRTYISTLDPDRAEMFSKKASPRRLNELGSLLLSNCEGLSFIEENKSVLFQWLDEKNPKTALDVEKAALEVLIENVDNDIFNGLKNWVYNSPSMEVQQNGEAKEVSVTMRDVCFVISLPLRDAYLQAHPEIETE